MRQININKSENLPALFSLTLTNVFSQILVFTQPQFQTVLSDRTPRLVLS